MKSLNLFQNIKYLSVIALLVLTALSYHPLFSSVVTDLEGTNPLSNYIMLMAGVCFILHLNLNAYKQDESIKRMLGCFFIILVLGFILNVVGIDESYIGEAKNIGMAMAFLLIGYSAGYDNKRVEILVLVYSLVVAYCTYAQIIQNFGGFVINDQYMQYGKNTLGVMTASSCIACIIFASFNDRKYLKYLEWLLAAILLFLTITIRARAAMLTIFAIGGYILIRKYWQQNASRYLIGIIIAILVVISIFPSSFDRLFSYIFDSFTQNQGTDLTSGRMDRNTFAIDLICRSPLFGNMALREHYDLIHNYFLRVLSYYGCIGAFPLLYMYLYIIIKTIKCIKVDKVQISSIGLIVVLVPYVISLEEPTFPYAPGTGSILSFLLLGCSLFNRNCKS